jgi:hypothetical protein
MARKYLAGKTPAPVKDSQLAEAQERGRGG